jgi:hypothetical protein
LHQFAFPPAVYEGSFFPTSLPTPVGGGVFDDGYSNGVRWNLSVVLICIYFRARDGEHFFMFFLLFEFLLLKKFCLVQLSIFIGSLILRQFSFLSSLYILVISP